MTATTKLSLELLANSPGNQIQSNTTFAILNQLVQAGAVDKDLSTPPVSPADEALYIVAGSPAGAWSGQTGKLAYWLVGTGKWQFITPREGMFVHVNDEDAFYKYNGSSWEPYAVITAGIPQNIQSADYTLVIADNGKHIFHPSADTTPRTFTIPSNASVAFPVGAAVTFVNQDSAGAVTISISRDTMRFAGSGATGSRTLNQNGIATALKITSNEWVISGVGLE
nr:DUF2793 domain-containing protein [Pseudomonas sp. UBA6718]